MASEVRHIHPTAVPSPGRERNHGAPDGPLASVTPVTAATRSRGAHSTSRRRRSAGHARRPRTAFVLSGGASLAALQAGMLHALYEHGIAPDLLVATSAGALNATFVASRPQTVPTARALAGVWRELQRDDVFPVSPSAVVRGLLGKRGHLVAVDALRKLLARHLQFDDLADAPIPLHAVAFDVDSGAEVLLSEGPAADVLTATAAIPGVFPPVELGGRRLIDGGVVNNTPISHAVELGAERVYVLPTMDRSFARPVEGRTAVGAAVDAIGLMMRSRLHADIARFASEVELIVLPAPNPLNVMPTDFGHADRLVRDGLHAARERLSQVLAA
jgi:NTE family protein